MLNDPDLIALLIVCVPAPHQVYYSQRPWYVIQQIAYFKALTSWLKWDSSQDNATQFECVSRICYWFGCMITRWGRATHICVGNLTIIVSDNGLSPGRRPAITWINVGILWIGLLRTNFNEMSIEIHTFSLKKIHLKMSSGKWRPFCIGLNVIHGNQRVCKVVMHYLACSTIHP